MSERERARKRETREVERKREEASEKKGPSFFGVGTSKKKKNTPSLTIPSLPVPLSPSLQTPTKPILTPQEKNVDRFRQQLKALGFSYDWQREVSTTDPQYYKWTQWIFLKLFERGLAYQATVPVNWCPALGTVLATPEQRPAVEAYIASAASKSDLERTAEKSGAAARSGVDTGSFAVHPVTGAQVPVWVADYVLGSYGTGAVMAVPAHDTRDADFARTHSLPTVEVVVDVKEKGEKSDDDDRSDSSSSSSSTSSSTSNIFTSDGVCVSSSGAELDLNGLASADARTKVGAFLAARGRGGPRVSYKLRDWLFARQRYWGEPFPIAYGADDEAQDLPLAIDEADLPLVLPPTDDFSPNGTPDPPLAALSEWVNFEDPKTGRKLVRETSTMPQWAGSCWYYIRYLQPWNDERLVDRAAADYWLPVDLYVGEFDGFF